MFWKNLKWLQFFAAGAGASGGAGAGDGGDGAGSGANAADAGRTEGVRDGDAGHRLEDLGVPTEKAERYRARMAKKKGRAEAPKADSAAGQEPPAAETETPAAEDPAPEDQEAVTESGQQPAAMDWDAFFQIPENQQRLQSMMAQRGRSATEAKNAAQEQMGKLAPVLELLAGRYGVDAGANGEYDLDALAKAVTGDDLFFEDRALETGESVDKVKSDWQRKQEQAQQQKQERDLQLREHFFKLQQQAQALRQEIPDFDLGRELSNPEFLRLTAPEMGWDVRKAYRAVHQDEIERQQAERIAQQTRAAAARTVRDGQARPRENGSGGGAVNAAPNLKAMTREERIAYMRSKYPPR